MPPDRASLVVPAILIVSLSATLIELKLERLYGKELPLILLGPVISAVAGTLSATWLWRR